LLDLHGSRSPEGARHQRAVFSGEPPAEHAPVQHRWARAERPAWSGPPQVPPRRGPVLPSG